MSSSACATIAAIHHGLTQPQGALSLVKGGWLGPVQDIYPSEMAQNFWTAIFAWLACFTVTIVVSLLTRRQKSDEELRGLVSSLTPRTREETLVWYKRPGPIGALVLLVALILNIVFW